MTAVETQWVGGNNESVGQELLKNVPICFSIYLVKLGNRNILIDAGCDNILGFDMRKFYSPAFVLRQAEVTSKDITDVIITHAHHDHIEAVKHFENAVIHITQDEYENRRKYISNVVTVSVFSNEYLLTPQIKIVQWGGHTKGSAIVQIETDNITHIFAGDECYTAANIVKRIPTGSSINQIKSKKSSNCMDCRRLQRQ